VGAYGHHYGDAAVSYELSAMFPKAGGQYVYIKEAYGKLIGLRLELCRDKPVLLLPWVWLC
jgi:amino acid transporter